MRWLMSWFTVDSTYAVDTFTPAESGAVVGQ
jgi:hypothetical protein